MYVAGARSECGTHQHDTGQYLAPEMLAVAVEGVDCHCRAGVHHDTGRLQLRPGSDHRNPAIDTHASRLLVSITDAAGLTLRLREMNVATAVHADDARKPGSKRLPRDIAGKHGIDISRQPGSQHAKALVPHFLQRDVPGLVDLLAVQHTPLDPSISDVKQQRFHLAVPTAPFSTIEPDITRDMESPC